MYTGLSSNIDKINEIINSINELHVDGETMEYIVNNTRFDDYLHRYLIMSRPLEYSKTFIEEKIEIQL